MNKHSFFARGKKLALTCLSASALLTLNFTTVHAQGFLKANGRIITNEKGQKVILRGMGLGGWMLQEGYMFRLSNLGQQHKIRAAIEDVAGPEYTTRFYEKWLANHTRKIDVDSMASWGFNSIRLPMHYNLYTLPVDKEPVAGKNTWLEKGFALTDSLLKWCKANHMYLILDLHATPGGQGNDLPISDRYPDQPSLWDSKANQEKTVALWRKLAERYANEPSIGGYDIINEPNWGFEDPKDTRGTAETKNEPLRKLMMDITKAIREVDKKHIIIIEGNGFGNNYRGIFPLWDKNMVVSFHKYGNFNNEGAIQGFLSISKENSVPLWMGESGENSNTWFTEAIKLVESHDIGWSWWQEKKIGVNQPLEIKLTPSYQKLLNYWTNKGEKPSQQEAIAALDEFLNNVKLENTIYHKDVTDAMFRQVHTNATAPFKPHIVTNKAIINSADYDLGSQRYAYYDKDTSSYQYTPGVNTQGNKGHAYRNDGVDIKKYGSGYTVFSIEDGEWLQYTLNVKQAGTYKIIYYTSGNAQPATIEAKVQGIKTYPINIPATTAQNDNWNKAEIANVQLNKGVNKLKLLFIKGGLELKQLEIQKQ
ncbi:hypothetical protein GCM10027037_35810 [Mucilaginibacter koreensis]